MSNPPRKPSWSKRDSTGSVHQNRLLDLANVSASSMNGTNPGETGDMQVSRSLSFSKETTQGSQDSCPSTPQSQTFESPSSSNSGGIDIPLTTGRDGTQVGVVGGGSSSSGGEHQSPSLVSVLQSASSPPSMSYLSSPGPGSIGPGSGSIGPRGGSSSSSEISGGVAGSSFTDQSFGCPSGSTVPISAVLNASGEDASSSKEDDSIRSEPVRGASSTPDPMHPSQSEPIFLKPGESLFVDYQSPVSGREDRSPKSAKKKPKSSPWYSVLASTYKSKCEEFRKLFKTIPSNERLLMDYSCALQKDILVQGRMFITEGWLCFYANIFKWETVLTIRFKDVTAITKERTIRFIPNAIQISTDSEKYFFTSFMSREKSFLLLFRIWQNALLEQTMPSSEYWSWVHSNYGSDLGIQGEELPADFLEAEGLDNLDNEDSTEDISQSIGSEDQSFDEVFSGSKDESQTDDGDGITMTVPSQGKENEADNSLDTTDDIGEVVDPLSSLDFGGKEIINETFDIPVDRLFTALYGSQHSFCKKFLEYRKCTDIEIGDWVRHDSDRDKRKLSYVLHLNTSLGYKACGVEENHMFQKNWSKTGQSYIVEKEVYNKNVPYCDYFYVHTCHVLTMISPTSSRLRFIMRLEFLKSALGLVKSFIERNVESGVKQGERELVKFIRDHLESVAPPKKRKGKKRRSQHPNRETEEKRRTEVQPQSTTQSGFLANLTPVWFQPNTETKLSLHSTMAFISIILAVLCVFNVSLFLQLKSLEEGTASKQVWSSAEFVQKLGELPKSEKDWTVLLQQQQQMHSKEMQKWRDIVDLCIQLIKQMEATLGELHSGISPTDTIPNIKELLQPSLQDINADHQTPDGG
nr:protein Aster-B-like isoform X1 [Lytechinus pictus]